MRKLTISLIAAGMAVGAAAPAAAQFYPQPAYGQTYHQARLPGWLYNFRDNRYASMMQDRVQRLRHDIRQMAAMRVLSRGEARSLDSQARNLQNRIWRYSRNGVGPGEARAIDRQVRRLEERVMREANDWNRRPNVRRYNPYNYNQYWQRYGY
jgi:hypothetical protein